MITQNKQAQKRNRRKKHKLQFSQDFIPIKEIRNGIIETTDGRYVKILEIEPINFLLRSSEEQFNIISSFASWLKISPMRLQFKSLTRKADSDKHISMLRQDLENESCPECKEMGEEYVNLVKDVGSREALTRRFFLIFQYEQVSGRRASTPTYEEVYSMIQTVVQNARTYFLQCGNSIVQPKDEDTFTTEMLYMFFNRRSCVDDPFQSRLDRVVVDTMTAKKKTMLLPKKTIGSKEYVRSLLYPAMSRFFYGKEPVYYPDCVIIFRHVYDRTRPERGYRDHDNLEVKTVTDIVALYVMKDDAALRCRHYYCSTAGDSDRTEIYVLHQSELPEWLETEKSFPDSGVELLKNYP